MTEQTDYVVETAKPFDEVVSSIESATAEAAFRVLAVHDVQATLQGKGFEMEPTKVIEICNAKHAHAVLTADPRISYMLPCRISVYRRDGKTFVGMMLPSIMSSFFPDADIAAVSEEVERTMKQIIDRSV